MKGTNSLAILGGRPEIPEGLIQKWPPIEEVDEQYVLDSLRGTNHAYGPNCTAFEHEFAVWNGNAYAITTNSGTAALHMAVAACGCGAGDEVIVPAYSWSSSATCALHHNALPVFVDIDYETMNIDVAKIEVAITERTKAIIAAHLHGLPVDMEPLVALARKHHLRVIEDACQAHGAMYKGRKAGTLGDCAAFSFNQNKCLCSGEGGMFVTNDAELYRQAMMVWSFGETRAPNQSRDYHAYALGWMYRNNDLTAAFGRAQLMRLGQYLATTAENAKVLMETLSGTKGLLLPTVPEGFATNWYNFTSRVIPAEVGYDGPAEVLRNAVMRAIAAEGVPVGIWQAYILPLMTVFRAQNAYGGGSPWNYGRPISYDAAQYPEAQRHCDTHFGMTTPLRAPNGPDVAKAVGNAFRKVFENIAALDIEEIGAKA